MDIYDTYMYMLSLWQFSNLYRRGVWTVYNDAAQWRASEFACDLEPALFDWEGHWRQCQGNAWPQMLVIL